MRVFYLTPNPNRASSNVPVEGWFETLRPRGLFPVVASHAVGAFHCWALDRGIPAFHVPLPFPSRRQPLPFLRSLSRLHAIARRYRVELIHCIEQDVYPIGRLLARLARVPIVVGVHNKVERPFCEWLFRGRRQPDRLFFISRGSLEACRPAVGGIVEAARWRLLYNGLDTMHYRPDPALGRRFREAHGVGTEPLAGVVCALRPGKQVEHAVEAAARLPNSSFRLVLAGGAVPGQEAYAKAVVAAARERLGARLIYVGHLDKDDLQGVYNAIEVLINTSAAETCSMTVLEALACGCPVLGYPSTSVHEQVLPGGGVIVPQNDIAALARQLDQWLQRPDLLRGRRAAARRRAEDGFEIGRIAAQLWDEYCTLTRSSRQQ
jgi:glycosyltransferase involved in cell wall biosynthesis